MIYSLDKINEMADGDQDFINSVVSVFFGRSASGSSKFRAGLGRPKS